MISETFEQEGLKIPMEQLSNYLAACKKEIYGSPKTRLSELALWCESKEGFAWYMEKLPMFSIVASDTLTVYSVAVAASSGKITKKQVTAYQQQMTDLSWTSFEEYEQCVYSTWQIVFDCDNWNTSTCTCPVYLKQYRCKYLVAIAYINNRVEIPIASKDVLVAKNKPRGRQKELF